MKKLLALGFLSLFIGSQANAAFMNVTTGADMAGIQVTATFDGGATETLMWQVQNAGNGGTDTVSLESEVGGVLGQMFSLTQQGDSLGNIDDNGTPGDFGDDIFYGLWTLTNLSANTLTSFVINVMDTSVLFDSVFDDNGNGSELGRAFIAVPSATATAAAATFSYDDQYMDELYRELTVNLSLDAQSALGFMADTDMKVPTPATLSILLLALGGLVARRKKA